MRKSEAKKKIEDAGGTWKEFEKWMFGQTVGVGDDGEIDYYDHDVNRFIGYTCNSKNEPITEWD